MSQYKFGKRESDALFDLMQTLGLSNVDNPVSYLKVIKAAHKEILELRGSLEAYKTLYQETRPTSEQIERERKFGRLGRHMFDI